VIHVPKGTHRFKFIVDDEWKCSDDLPVSTDTDGNLVNFLEVEDETGLHQKDGLDVVAEFSEGLYYFYIWGDCLQCSNKAIVIIGKFPSVSQLSESPPSSYTFEQKAYLEA
jgi:hypothetical protein